VVGKWADLALVGALPGGEEPEMEVLEAAAEGGVEGTVVGGRFVYGGSGA
jgi:hypothetical protein